MAAFRFAMQASGAASPAAWRDLARKCEDIGYSTLYVPDHLDDQWAPMVACTVAAEATTTLARRHPGPRQRLPPSGARGPGGGHPRRRDRRSLRVRHRRRVADGRLRPVRHPDGPSVRPHRATGREPRDHARACGRPGTATFNGEHYQVPDAKGIPGAGHARWPATRHRRWGTAHPHLGRAVRRIVSVVPSLAAGYIGPEVAAEAVARPVPSTACAGRARRPGSAPTTSSCSAGPRRSRSCRTRTRSSSRWPRSST